jgi:BirA family transcriptional regulator, biotin operon repressor / biotin---[acetyl-CoA-carboxylase] ligase
MDFTEFSLAARLTGKHIGNSIHFFNEVDSTNNIAYRLALHGASEGTMVIAERQTKGKGRLNRSWQSLPKCNLYTSIILKPDINPVFAPQITLLAGVAVAELISQSQLVDVSLKWPNDVLIRGKKVCGILTEMKTSADRLIDFIVVGIGININIKKEDFDESFRNISTSLKEETGKDVSRLDIAASLCDHFERWYTIWTAQGFSPVRKEWLQYSFMVGKRIQVDFRGDIQTGEMLGIDEFGALLVSNEEGMIKKIIAGDATVIKNDGIVMNQQHSILSMHG